MSQPTFETLLYDVEDGIATITLNRPDRMNAFTARMMKDMIEVFDITDADDAVKAVIVTGAGRAFCAGADLGGGGGTFDRSSPQAVEREEGKVGDVYRDGGGRVTLRMYDSLKPIIGAINGAAVGVGVTMQLPMDIRMASTAAKFGFVFARRGINPEAASSWFLPRLVGLQTALEWCYTGRVFDAQEALDRAWSARCTSPTTCCRPPEPWPARSPTTPPRSQWRSPASCCGAWPARPTRWKPTWPTAGPSSRAARPATPRRA